MFEAVVYVYDRDTVERPAQKFTHSVFYPEVYSAELFTIPKEDLPDDYEAVPDEDNLYLVLNLSSGARVTYAYNRVLFQVLSPRL